MPMSMVRMGIMAEAREPRVEPPRMSLRFTKDLPGDVVGFAKSPYNGNSLRISCIGLARCLFQHYALAKDWLVGGVAFVGKVGVQGVGHIHGQHEACGKIGIKLCIFPPK